MLQLHNIASKVQDLKVMYCLLNDVWSVNCVQSNQPTMVTQEVRIIWSHAREVAEIKMVGVNASRVQYHQIRTIGKTDHNGEEVTIVS